MGTKGAKESLHKDMSSKVAQEFLSEGTNCQRAECTDSVKIGMQFLACDASTDRLMSPVNVMKLTCVSATVCICMLSEVISVVPLAWCNHGHGHSTETSNETTGFLWLRASNVSNLM